MKRKNIFSCAALLLATSCFAACANTSQKTSFNSNWQTDSTVIQNDLTETLEYNVRFEKSTPTQNDFSLDYTNGTYTTSLKTEYSEGRIIYIYESTLQIDVIYQFGQESKQLTDRVYSHVEFEDADSFLRPLSSYKETLSHSPANGATSLDKCYETYHHSIDIKYTENGAGEMVYKNLADENSKDQKESFKVSTKKYTHLDNEQLLFAIRGINPSQSTTAKFNVYSPFINRAQKVKVSFDSATSRDFTFTKNGTSIKETIQYYPVKIALDETNPGATQTAWVAKSTSTTSNVYRNVVLRLETPLSYNLGSLVYELKSATFSN